MEIRWDPETPGMGVRCHPTGKKTVMIMFRVRGDKSGKDGKSKSRVLDLGRWYSDGTDETLKGFREKARQLLENARRGIDPKAAAVAEAQAQKQAQEWAQADMVDAVINRYLKHDVRARGLRSADTIERAFARLVRPQLGKRNKYELRRADIINLLDHIADTSGDRMADLTLSYLGACFNWEARRDETFRSPIVRGMARLNAKEQARARILSDEELRDLFAGLDTVKAPEPFGRYIRVLLCTASRRSEVSHMTWEEITSDDDGVTWVLTPERTKAKVVHGVPLVPPVMALLGKPSTGYVFSADGGKTPFSAYDMCKGALDAAINEIRAKDGREPMAHWVLHDLRRSARSLLSRAGVPADIAERCLGHVLQGMRATYDRHSYSAEKRDALERLSTIIARIVKPPTGNNVASLAEARAVRS
jgi:integrase